MLRRKSIPSPSNPESPKGLNYSVPGSEGPRGQRRDRGGPVEPRCPLPPVLQLPNPPPTDYTPPTVHSLPTHPTLCHSPTAVKSSVTWSPSKAEASVNSSPWLSANSFPSCGHHIQLHHGSGLLEHPPPWPGPLTAGQPRCGSSPLSSYPELDLTVTSMQGSKEAAVSSPKPLPFPSVQAGLGKERQWVLQPWNWKPIPMASELSFKCFPGSWTPYSSASSAR